MSGIYEEFQPKFSLNNDFEIRRSIKAYKATKRKQRGVLGEQAELFQNLPLQNVSESKAGSQFQLLRCHSSVREKHFKMKREPFDKKATRFSTETDLTLLPLSQRLRHFNKECEIQNFQYSNVPTYCSTPTHLEDKNISFNRKTMELKTQVRASKSIPPSGANVNAVDCPRIIKKNSSLKVQKPIKLKPFNLPLIPEATEQTMDKSSTSLKDFINLEAQYAPLMNEIQWESCHTSKKQLISSVKSNPCKMNTMNIGNSYMNQVKASLNDNTHHIIAQQGRDEVNPFCSHKNLIDYNRVPAIRNMKLPKLSNNGNSKKSEDISQEQKCIVPSLRKSMSCSSMGTVPRIKNKEGTYYGCHVMQEGKGNHSQTSQFTEINYERSKALNKEPFRESGGVTCTNVYSTFVNESEVMKQKKKIQKIKQDQQYESKQSCIIDKASSELNATFHTKALKCSPHYEKVKKFEEIFISENEYLTAVTDFDKLFLFKT